MKEKVNSQIIRFVNFARRHSLPTFITAAILIAITLVIISLQMYNLSGTAQIDLSRPGYKDIRSQATTGSGDVQTFSPTGIVDEKTIDGFKSLFDSQATRIKTANAFGGDPLNPDALIVTTTANTN